MQQLLFVYGTLKKGFHNHYLLDSSTFISKAVTKPIYTLYSNGNYPVVIRKGNTAIKGELYLVTDEVTLSKIYGLEGYKGVPGHPLNWYDADKLKLSKQREALIFVMDETFAPDFVKVSTGEFKK